MNETRSIYEYINIKTDRKHSTKPYHENNNINFRLSRYELIEKIYRMSSS